MHHLDHQMSCCIPVLECRSKLQHPVCGEHHNTDNHSQENAEDVDWFVDDFSWLLYDLVKIGQRLNIR